MVIDLKRLYNTAGERLELDFAVSDDKLRSVKGYCFTRPITVKGAIVNRAGVLTLDYRADFTLHVSCDRCLCEFDRDYGFEFSHTLVRELENTGDEFEEDYIVTEADDKLDMDELALLDSLLELPSKTLCREDCKGLCPVCGTNLNENQCEHGG